MKARLLVLARLLWRYLLGVLCFLGVHHYTRTTHFRRESGTELRLPDDSVLTLPTTRDFPMRGRLTLTTRACQRCGHERRG